VYLSKEQVALSIEQLGNVSVFFGTVFLAFKQMHLPIRDPQPVIFKKVVDTLLHKYYLYYPPDKHSKDRRIYTPFLTSHTRNRWNKEPFSDSLRRTTDLFSDAFHLVRTHMVARGILITCKNFWDTSRTTGSFPLSIWLCGCFARGSGQKTCSQNIS